MPNNIYLLFYSECEGRIEHFYYNISDFFERPEFKSGFVFKLPIWHPFCVLNVVVFLSDPIMVPFFYTRIYLFRKRLNEKKLGLGEAALMRRKQRNIVQMKYHLFTWIWENLIIVLLFSRPGLRLEYVLSMSCEPPLLYFLGIEENRVVTWKNLKSFVVHLSSAHIVGPEGASSGGISHVEDVVRMDQITTGDASPARSEVNTATRPARRPSARPATRPPRRPSARPATPLPRTLAILPEAETENTCPLSGQAYLTSAGLEVAISVQGQEL